ncbi:carotenoid biosynthesis protein [Kineosporia sp. A_224]|uniref:carotenoid biosynthesis protein n=1 Tax=Kineosporia sp. A_224 TaxID=1962180 RepID=UPI000B4BB039|nr:carotenoid biosynthesis protein [Kineosporia sp. A_224]
MDGSATTHPRRAPAGADGPAGPHGTGGAARALPHVLPLVLAGAVVLAQISYPLLSGEALRLSTIVTVLLFATASLVHAATTRGARAALAVLVVAGGLGLLAETVGVRTGVPFGEYAYADSLGTKALGVPVVVPLAWTMMAWPCLLLGRRLAAGLPGRAARRAATAAAGGLTLAAWDLYLDPQMVAAGHWTWRFPEPALPGVPGVPLTNYAGWVLVALVMVAALDVVVPRSAPDADPGAQARADLVPAALLAWTWLGSGLANLAFFDRPAVAGYGLLAMGVCAGPYLVRVVREVRR